MLLLYKYLHFHLFIFTLPPLLLATFALKLPFFNPSSFSPNSSKMSLKNEATHSPEHEVNPNLQQEQMLEQGFQAKDALRYWFLEPSDSGFVFEEERVLHHNYEIGPSVWLHFQDPAILTINGSDITL
jgi:hypothetical protein